MVKTWRKVTYQIEKRHLSGNGHSNVHLLLDKVDYFVVTWLILPVVICLSQRLSHACLSISTYTVKLRMAH
jgi:hypothetical protein